MIGVFIGAWLDVRSKPLRTFAAIVGMVAAVITVVLVNAAGILSHEANDAYLARKYGLPISVTIRSDARSTPAQREAITATLGGNGISALSVVTEFTRTTVSYQGSDVGTEFIVISPEYREVRIVDVIAGAWPQETAQGDVLHAVVTEEWVANFLAVSPQQAVGTVINYTSFFREGRTSFTYTGLDARRSMVIDAVVSNESLSGTDLLGIVAVAAEPPIDTRSFEASPVWLARVNPQDFGLLQGLVGSVTAEDGTPVFRAERTDQADELQPVLDQQDVTARAVTVVALMIGGLGILGVGMASVRERAREFGLRRALGASRVRIFCNVIVQTLLEIVIAAAIAIPLAAILLQRFSRSLVLETLPLPPSTTLPLESAALGLVGALAVGLIAGLMPAVNAARTSVVQAIRA